LNEKLKEISMKPEAYINEFKEKLDKSSSQGYRKFLKDYLNSRKKIHIIGKRTLHSKRKSSF